MTDEQLQEPLDDALTLEDEELGIAAGDWVAFDSGRNSGIAVVRCIWRNASNQAFLGTNHGTIPATRVTEIRKKQGSADEDEKAE